MDLSLVAQATLLLGICFVAEAASRLLKLPIPGNVLGMLLLFALLCAGVVKPGQVSRASGALLSNMTLFFVPNAAALIIHYHVITGHWAGFLGAILLSSLLTFAVTGRVAQHFLPGSTPPSSVSPDLAGGLPLPDTFDTTKDTEE